MIDNQPTLTVINGVNFPIKIQRLSEWIDYNLTSCFFRGCKAKAE